MAVDEWRPKALEQIIPSAKPSDAENDLLPYYSDCGKTLTFANKTELAGVVGADNLAAIGVAPYFPVKLELNVPWSISRRPGTHLHRRVCLAVCYQLTTNRTEVTVCDVVDKNWVSPSADTWTTHHKCLFSRNATSATAPGALLGHLEPGVAQAGLDTVALFPVPVLVRKVDKQTVRGAKAGTWLQQWFAVHGCTNCIAAGTFQTCTHYSHTYSLRKTRPPLMEFHVGSENELTAADQTYGRKAAQVQDLIGMDLIKTTG